MEKWAGIMFDLLIFAEKLKKHRSGTFLWGKQKALITKSRRVHPLHKVSSKNPDFEAIYHFHVDSYHTLLWSQTFFVDNFFFFFFARRRRWVDRDSCSPLRGSLAALSCGEKSRKTSVTRVTTHKQKKDAFLNTPASIIMLEFQQNRRKPQVMKFVFFFFF